MSADEIDHFRNSTLASVESSVEVPVTRVYSRSSYVNHVFSGYAILKPNV